jgi:hypothetical protein
VAGYLYQYLPVQLQGVGTVWGALAPFTADSNDQALIPTAQYFASNMLTTVWCKPGTGTHVMFPTTSNVTDSSGDTLVSAYTVLRPDDNYSVLLVNSDTSAHQVQVTFSSCSTHSFYGVVHEAMFSPANYVWIPNGANGTAKPDGPISTSNWVMMPGRLVNLPARSMVVLMGRVL